MAKKNKNKQPANEIVTKDSASGVGDFGSATLAFALGAYPGHSGVVVTPYSAMQSSAVYGCVKAIAEDIAKLPIRVKRRLPTGGYADVRKHPIAKLFRRPNNWDQTLYTFHKFVVQSYLLRGNSYIYVVRDDAGTPTQLVAIPVDRVGVTISPTTGRIYYTISHPLLNMGQPFKTDNEDLMHIKNISFDGIFGMSVIALSQDSIGIALAAQTHAATMFAQGTAFNAILTTDQPLKPETVIQLRTQWQQSNGGVGNHWSTPILHSGMKLQPVQMTAEDSQLLESRKDSRIEIASLFRVPPSKIGIITDKSTVEAENLKYREEVLSPLFVQLEQIYEALCLDDDDDLEIRFAYEDDSTADLKTRHAAYQSGIMAGYYNINEVRGFLRMPPIEGGDAYRVPMNTAPLESDSLVGEVMGTPPANLKPTEDTEDPEEKPEGDDDNVSIDDE